VNVFVSHGGDSSLVEPVTVPCQQCGVELADDSPDLRLELACDDEPLRWSALSRSSTAEE
jgi:hypothetical protein